MSPHKPEEIAGPTGNQDARLSNSEKICIAVMGVAGSGKSSFVKLACRGETTSKRTHASGSHSVEAHSFDLSSTIFLVHTPDIVTSTTTENREESFKDIIRWMEKCCWLSDQRLRGIVYMHRITDDFTPESATENLMILKELCQSGSNTPMRVVLCTTMWDQVDKNISETRERQLIKTSDMWGSMMKGGSDYLRHHNTVTSAMEIINTVLGRASTVSKRLSLEKSHLSASEAVHNEESTCGSRETPRDQQNRELEKEAVDYEYKKMIMHEKRELAMQRCREEKDRLEAEKQKRIQAKRAALGSTPEHKSARKEAARPTEEDAEQRPREADNTNQAQPKNIPKEAEELDSARQTVEALTNQLIDTQDQLASSEMWIRDQTITIRRLQTDLNHDKAERECLSAENEELKKKVQSLERTIGVIRILSPANESATKTNSSSSKTSTWVPKFSVSLTKRSFFCIGKPYSSTNMDMPRLSKNGEDIIFAVFSGKPVGSRSRATAGHMHQPYAAKCNGPTPRRFSVNFRKAFAELDQYLSDHEKGEIDYIALGPSSYYYIRHYDGSYYCRGLSEFVEAVGEYHDKGYSLTEVSIGMRGAFLFGYEGKEFAGYRRCLQGYYPALSEFLDEKRESKHKIHVEAISLAVDSATDFILLYRQEGEDDTFAQWHISDPDLRQGVSDWWRACRS